MAETHDQRTDTSPDEPFVRSEMTRGQELHVESHAPYLKVFGALAAFTAIEYFYAHFFKDLFLFLILGLLFWAVIKAMMVGWYFMHLKFEGRWVYYFLIPAGILAAILVFALIPDVGMQPVAPEPAEDEVSAAPLEPGTSLVSAQPAS